MLRSRLLLCANEHHPTSSLLPERIRGGGDRFLLLATFGGLIVSASTLSAQTDASSSKDQPMNPQAQICDALGHSDPHRLSLGIDKEQLLDREANAAGQQTLSQSGSESTGKEFSLPQDKLSSSVALEQELQCKKKKSGAQLAHPVDPSPRVSPAADLEPAPTVPTVSYVGGMLTINAQNVPLRDVFEAIRVHTGIFVELPAESMDDPVFDHVGPAPLRDALTQFVYGAKLNYVIQTSSDDPQKVTKLILSSQPHLASAGSQQHANLPEAVPADTPALYGAGGFASESPAEPIQPVLPVNQPTPSATNLVGVPAGFNVQQAATASGKTPGQILDELQKRQVQALDDQSAPQ